MRCFTSCEELLLETVGPSIFTADDDDNVVVVDGINITGGVGRVVVDSLADDAWAAVVMGAVELL